MELLSLIEAIPCLKDLEWPRTWYGMVWYGLVWYSMVCYGMLWYHTIALLRSGCTPPLRLGQVQQLISRHVFIAGP